MKEVGGQGRVVYRWLPPCYYRSPVLIENLWMYPGKNIFGLLPDPLAVAERILAALPYDLYLMRRSVPQISDAGPEALSKEDLLVHLKAMLEKASFSQDMWNVEMGRIKLIIDGNLEAR